MHNFKITKPDENNCTVEVTIGDASDLYTLTNNETLELLNCVKATLDGVVCEHTSVHRIEANNSSYNILFSISDRHVRSYAVSKRKLIEFKMGLMGALNG